MQHEQDAVEGGLIAHCELACATFGGGSEGGDQGLQLQPQFFANGLSCHEGMKHNCFMRVSWAVVLATLRIRQKGSGSRAIPCDESQNRTAFLIGSFHF